jgi:hypothetical protein
MLSVEFMSNHLCSDSDQLIATPLIRVWSGRPFVVGRRGTGALKTESDRDLSYTRIYDRTADDAERRRCEVGIWVRKLGMVE